MLYDTKGYDTCYTSSCDILVERKGIINDLIGNKQTRLAGEMKKDSMLVYKLNIMLINMKYLFFSSISILIYQYSSPKLGYKSKKGQICMFIICKYIRHRNKIVW